MAVLFEKFLVSLSMAILERVIAKGTTAAKKYIELKAELESNQKKADEYSKTIKLPGSREDRKNAEDDLLN